MCLRVDDTKTRILILFSAFTGSTENSVQRYHKRLTEIFAIVHPNLAAFVEVIRMFFKFYE
ncbi:hypothetical protein HZS_6929 [Henneguya salminicola]|nr:hypothetical protein HZS_6929 [Henneguya salminicola]